MNTRIDETLRQPNYDGLIAGNNPEPEIFSITIRKLSAVATLKRGTVLALSSGSAGDGKMVILGTSAETNETLTADCILCDDVEVGTAADVEALAYRDGTFSKEKLIVAADYTMTATDKHDLRMAGIQIEAAI